MKVTASLKNYGRPARKMRDLIVLVKGLKASQALSQLAVVSRYGARDLETLIKSAIANAKNNYNLDEKSLKVTGLVVDGGTVLKRWMPRAYGNANRILKRTCSLEVILEGDELKTVKRVVKKDSKKEENKKEQKEETTKTDEPAKKPEKKPVWSEEEKEDLLKEDKKVVGGGQNWAKKVFRRKSF